MPAIAALDQLGGEIDQAKIALAWLASDEADWITGQVTASDGGWSAL
jgi:NAD(P)-dependent dehydrogenase (short-subunit alcohol dehydrogenase family)